MLPQKAELVRNWLIKAKRDLAAARRLASGPESYLDVAIYHCQQAAEKALKAFLSFYDEPPEKTHDVGALIARCERRESGFHKWVDAAAFLTPYATVFRYPGDLMEPDQAEFDEALQMAAELYEFVLSVLPHSVHPAA